MRDYFEKLRKLQSFGDKKLQSSVQNRMFTKGCVLLGGEKSSKMLGLTASLGGSAKKNLLFAGAVKASGIGVQALP